LNTQYDYIIAGAGASGLSLAWKLLQSSLNKKVLIVDKNIETQNDKTWCFWDSGSPAFADIIHKQWSQVEVSAFGTRFTQPLEEYSYYCLRSVDFEKKILNAIKSHPQFDLLEGKVADLASNGNKAIISFRAALIPGKTRLTTLAIRWCNTFWDGKSHCPNRFSMKLRLR
jgi:lycopene beta-cyclase